MIQLIHIDNSDWIWIFCFYIYIVPSKCDKPVSQSPKKEFLPIPKSMRRKSKLWRAPASELQAFDLQKLGFDARKQWIMNKANEIRRTVRKGLPKRRPLWIPHYFWHWLHMAPHFHVLRHKRRVPWVASSAKYYTGDKLKDNTDNAEVDMDNQYQYEYEYQTDASYNQDLIENDDFDGFDEEDMDDFEDDNFDFEDDGYIESDQDEFENYDDFAAEDEYENYNEYGEYTADEFDDEFENYDDFVADDEFENDNEYEEYIADEFDDDEFENYDDFAAGDEYENYNEYGEYTADEFEDYEEAENAFEDEYEKEMAYEEYYDDEANMNVLVNGVDFAGDAESLSEEWWNIETLFLFGFIGILFCAMASCFIWRSKWGQLIRKLNNARLERKRRLNEMKMRARIDILSNEDVIHRLMFLMVFLNNA